MLYDQYFIDDLKDRADLVRRVCLIAIMLLGSGVGANAQDSPKAVLIDEFGRLACDDFLGRLDVFFAELRAAPEAQGVVVIRTSPEDRPDGVFVQEMVKAHFKWRGWKQKPLGFVRADGGRDRFVQLWLIPPGAETPSIERELQTFQLPIYLKKPFVLALETKFGAVNCPEIDDRSIFASFLLDNSKARGNIVVRDRSPRSARRKAGMIVRSLVATYGVSRIRLRTFYARLQRPSNHDEPVVEYWYLP